MKRFRHAGMLLASVVLAAVCGCTPASHPAKQPEKPILEMDTFDVGGGQTVAVKLLRTDGAPLAYFMRANHGVVVCPHFDLEGLRGGGTPAAMAKDWKVNGLKGELDAKIEKVNALAAAKGVTVGMTVREALARMTAPDKPVTAGVAMPIVDKNR